jgi:predicted DNA-binding transcriptional regulator AlpA
LRPRNASSATEVAAEAGVTRSSNIEPQNDRFLTAPMVERRYSVSAMTLWRWLKSDLGFPKPIYIGRYRYWRERELQVWESLRPRLRSERGDTFASSSEAAARSVPL